LSKFKTPTIPLGNFVKVQNFDKGLNNFIYLNVKPFVMKKLYFVLIGFLVFSGVEAQIVNIPDPILKANLLGANSSNNIASSQTPVYNAMNNYWYATPYNSVDTNGDGEIQVSEAQTIKWLAFTNLDISNATGIEAFTNLEFLSLSGNLLENFDITNLTHLRYLNVGHNTLSTLDVTSFPSLVHLWCYDNLLQSLFIKNNANWVNLGFDANFDMEYVCADEDDLAFVQSRIDINNYTSCHTNSYCSFTPGGTFYTLYGNNRWDSDNNGCNTNDVPYPNLKLNITNGSQAGSLTFNNQGNYSIPLQAGTYTLTPVLENPNYFSTVGATVSFPASTSPFNQNFCITANGNHHDVEVTLIPIRSARPGFDAKYLIIYKNKGTVTEYGSIQLSFNDNVLDYVISSDPTSNLSTNSVSWDYYNLKPLQTKVIGVTFNVNSPTETPAVNIGDHLIYTATIAASTTDEFQSDNTSSLNQTVVGSYDPNSKTCVEGTNVGINVIGQYVHYVIHFENTGTYSAQNVVVSDIIDTTKYDVTSLIPLYSNHDFVTRVNGNKVEFIFQNINLPFDDANNDGYVAFKIKTKPTLSVGSTFSNTANIYFDYNAPIVTNTATTTIATLANPTFAFSDYFTLSPIPTKGELNITTKQDITISSISIYNTLGQVVLVTSNPSNTIDVSNLTTGSYFIKVITDKGTSSGRFIKE
jgi:uncharacterized repeat protein (TIGR01451 family)